MEAIPYPTESFSNNFDPSMCRCSIPARGSFEPARPHTDAMHTSGKCSGQQFTYGYDSTAYPCGCPEYAPPTTEHIAAHTAYLAAQRVKAEAVLAAYASRDLLPGREVRVVAGRKIPIGTIATVIRTSDALNGRVLLRIGANEVWTAQNNVETVEALPFPAQRGR